MREILFRGKSVATGNWIYGDLYTRGCVSIYASGEKLAVDQDTVGQYTGINDKNGDKIFEGDIVRRTELPFGLEDIGVVVFNVEKGCYGLEVEKYGYTRLISFVRNGTVNDGYCTVDWTAEFEVVGNIYEELKKT